MTKPIESLKLDIINVVVALKDYALLENLASSLSGDKGSRISIFDREPIEIISGATLDDLYAEQGSKPLVFADLPAAQEDWGYSLDEISPVAGPTLRRLRQAQRIGQATGESGGRLIPSNCSVSA